jgi:hypothetical protein
VTIPQESCGSLKFPCDRQWYCGTSPDWKWWNMSHPEPALLKVYSGKTEELITAIAAIMDGKEVVVPCMIGNNTDLQLRRGKIEYRKASLQLLDHNLNRDRVEKK